MQITLLNLNLNWSSEPVFGVHWHKAVGQRFLNGVPQLLTGHWSRCTFGILVHQIMLRLCLNRIARYLARYHISQAYFFFCFFLARYMKFSWIFMSLQLHDVLIHSITFVSLLCPLILQDLESLPGWRQNWLVYLISLIK